MEMLCISAIKHGSQQPHVGAVHLKYGYYDKRTELLTVFTFNYFKFKERHLTRGYFIGMHSARPQYF